jgi:hypothetical protein
VYWKPVWNVLEKHFHMVLANAQHIKAVPGRKTDMMDCQRIAELLRHGLLRGSYVPPLLVRDLRDLTRTRATLSQEQSRLSGKSRKGSPWLRRMACQSAWAAVRTKNCYLSTQFKRLPARRGSKRALLAVAHSLLVIGYHPSEQRLRVSGTRRRLLRSTSRGKAQATSGEEAREPRRQCRAATTGWLGRHFRGRRSRVETTIGIDLGDVWSHYCTINQDGEVVDRGRFQNQPEGS